MGQALVVFKIFPKGIEAIDIVEKGVKEIKSGDVKEVRKEPLAFGMSIIRAGIAIPDKEEGRMDKLEQEIKSLKGVGQVEVEGITLI